MRIRMTSHDDTGDERGIVQDSWQRLLQLNLKLSRKKIPRRPHSIPPKTAPPHAREQVE